MRHKMEFWKQDSLTVSVTLRHRVTDRISFVDRCGPLTDNRPQTAQQAELDIIYLL